VLSILLLYHSLDTYSVVGSEGSTSAFPEYWQLLYRFFGRASQLGVFGFCVSPPPPPPVLKLLHSSAFQNTSKMFQVFFSSTALIILLSISTIQYLPEVKSDEEPINYNYCDTESVTLLYSNSTLLGASNNFGAYTINLCNDTTANNSICEVQQKKGNDASGLKVNITIDFTPLYQDNIFMEYAVACKRSGGKFCAMSINGLLDDAAAEEDSLGLELNVIGYPSCFAANCNKSDIISIFKEYTEKFLNYALSVSADLRNSANLTTDLLC